MRIIDAYPATALTPFGGEATVVVEVESAADGGSRSGAVGSGARSAAPGRALLRVELLDLTAVVCAAEGEVFVPDGVSEHRLRVRVPASRADGGVLARGYQVRVSLEPAGREGRSEAMTALLVADHWRHAPRYGFLSEFAPEDEPGSAAGTERVKGLAKHHITIVQFYDWMYRHYRLLPPTDRFRDALDRELSLTTVRDRIAACHDRGMAAMAYGAVYGPEPEFILERPDWLLYDAKGDSISLIDLFYITDLRAGSGWREHILGEFEQAVAQLGFDGVHMDQYGFPKLAYDRGGALVDLSVDFPDMVNEAAARLAAVGRTRRPPGATDDGAERPEVGVIFNAVNDWPIDTVATSDQACVYIEVWDPHSRYADLVALARRARDLSGKQVILSAYLQPFRQGGESAEWALRYATAVIAAAGAHHLVLGEGNGVLRDPYYPNHGRLSPGGEAVVRRYYDHTAAFTHYLHALDLRPVERTFATGVNTALTVLGASAAAVPVSTVPVSTTPVAGSLYLTCAQRAGQLVINLVNLTGLSDDTWDAHQPAAPTLEGLVLTCEPFVRPTRVVHASPDAAVARDLDGRPEAGRELAWTVLSDGRVSIEIPPLTLWSTVVIDHH